MGLRIRVKRATALEIGRFTLFVACLSLLVAGCATAPPQKVSPLRQFVFEKDTFSFPNNLEKVRYYDADGNWVGHKIKPRPPYTLHCFVVSRSVLQFFEHARFAPELTKVDDETYSRLIHRVVDTDPRVMLPDDEKIVIPGYPDLRSFSRDKEQLLKNSCGGAWQSYVQRGHWRMVLPFTRTQQRHVGERLLDEVTHNQPAVVHLVRFPSLSINHAAVIYGACRVGDEIEFKIYDPNTPQAPATIRYRPNDGVFTMATNAYFPGGRIDLYQVYHSIFY